MAQKENLSEQQRLELAKKYFASTQCYAACQADHGAWVGPIRNDYGLALQDATAHNASKHGGHQYGGVICIN